MPGSENEIDDVELAQRRERGRLAQRAFRRRQIDTIRELREDNQALRDAIDEISRAAATGPAHAHNHQSQLQAAIQNAFRVAGLDASLARSLSDVGEDDDSDPPLNTPGFPQPQHQQQGLLEGGSIDPSLDFMSLGAPLIPTTAAATTSANIYSQLAAPTSPPYQTTSSDSSRSGRVSPRLTYGLWFEPDRAIRIVHPPHDIMPYVGEGMRSLAGTVFWTGMGFSLGAFRTLLNARYRGVVLDDPRGSSPDDPSAHDSFYPAARDDPTLYTYSNDDTNDALSLSVFRHAQPKRRQLLLSQHPPSRVVVVGGPDDEVLDDPHEDEVLDDDTFYESPAAAAEYAAAAAEFASAQHTNTPPANRPFAARGHQTTTPQSRSPHSSQQHSPSRHPPSQTPLTPAQKHLRYRRRVHRAHAIIQRMFSPTIRSSSEKTIYDILHARFTWRTKGWIAGDHPGRDPDGPMRLFSAILREPDHPAAYGEAHLWMTPVEVEGYLQNRLRMTPAGWGPWAEAIQGRGERKRVEMVNALVNLFVLNGMCFGDGPRWRADWVAKWTETWIEEVAAGPEGVGLWF